MDTFAFVIHPLELADITRKFGIAAKLPDSWVEAALKRLPPFTVSEITGVRSLEGNEVKGWFIGCPLTSRQMMELPEEVVMQKIIQSAKKAQDLGAKIVGLGAFTAVVGDAGVTVSRSVDIAVTTGNSYTVATALEGVELAARMFDVDLRKANIAVLGASGSIGKACARIMARRGFDVTLSARRREPLEEVAAQIQSEAGVGVQIETDLAKAVADADVIIAVTSAVDGILDGKRLKPGAIICDVARPRNVSKAVAQERRDVFVFEGGVVAPPGEVNFNFNFGFPPRTCYACMAETMALALEGRFEPFSLGRDLQVERVEEITAIARKHGFTLAGLRSFERAVGPEHVQQVKEAMTAGRAPMASGAVGKG